MLDTLSVFIENLTRSTAIFLSMGFSKETSVENSADDRASNNETIAYILV